MEITVRRGPTHTEGERNQHFVAAVTYLQPGPLALERIQLSAKSETYSGAMHILTEGFKVTPGAHGKDSVELKRELSELRRELEELRKELAEMKRER